jgi:hypothetical protein
MEKENKKSRDDSRKGYNETVRVGFYLFYTLFSPLKYPLRKGSR